MRIREEAVSVTVRVSHGLYVCTDSELQAPHNLICSVSTWEQFPSQVLLSSVNCRFTQLTIRLVITDLNILNISFITEGYFPVQKEFVYKYILFAISRLHCFICILFMDVARRRILPQSPVPFSCRL